MAVTTWPDGAMFKACAQQPARHFSDPDLQSATFEPDRRRGGVQAWSGGRATVVRANQSAGGSIAVRFSKQADRDAGRRYQDLGRYLAGHPVAMMVGTSWRARGLLLGADHFPILTMDWVAGTSLDNYLTRNLDNVRSGVFGELATQWRDGCRSLAGAQIGHGDVHAGNTLVGDGGAGRINLRLVDYDSVWFPGMTYPTRETGHPAFQHPRRSELSPGPNIDAVPNTLTYLSLIALADDPGLWQFHRVDDGLLFDRADLADPGRPVWAALLASRNPSVVALTRTTIDWLVGPPARFESLEQVLAASSATAHPGGPARVNVWAPRPVRPPNPVTSAQSRTAPSEAGRNTWPPKSGGVRVDGPAGSVTPPGPRSRQNSWPSAGPSAPPAPPAPSATPAGSSGALAALIVIAVLIVIVLVAAAAS